MYSVLRYSPPSIGFAQLSTAAGGSGTVTSETVSGTFTVTSPYPGTASAAGPSTPTSMCYLFLWASIVFFISFPHQVLLCQPQSLHSCYFRPHSLLPSSYVFKKALRMNLLKIYYRTLHHSSLVYTCWFSCYTNAG